MSTRRPNRSPGTTSTGCCPTRAGSFRTRRRSTSALACGTHKNFKNACGYRKPLETSHSLASEHLEESIRRPASRPRPQRRACFSSLGEDQDGEGTDWQGGHDRCKSQKGEDRRMNTTPSSPQSGALDYPARRRGVSFGDCQRQRSGLIFPKLPGEYTKPSSNRDSGGVAVHNRQILKSPEEREIDAYSIALLTGGPR